MRNKRNETIQDINVDIDYSNIKGARFILNAIDHKLRQRIMGLLLNSAPMTVTDIYIKLRLEQSVASQHLAKLRRAKIVTTERDGKYVYYSLNMERMLEISEFSKKLIN